jgi:predicted nucleotidyltransferase
VTVPSTPQVAAQLAAFFDATSRDVAAAYLFGSVGRSAAHEASDVDVAVLLERDPPRTLDGLHLDLAQQLEELLGRRVDLVLLNHAAADLAHRVLRDGILVCDRNRSARIRFEVRIRNEYFDLEPVRRQYRRAG